MPVDIAPIPCANSSTFDPVKASHAIVHLAKRLRGRPNLFTVMKALYFADKDHLHRYGRFVLADSYVAMEYGPVPRGAYDIFKSVRGDRIWALVSEAAKRLFRVESKSTIIPLAEPDLGYFSPSELECLDRAIQDCLAPSCNELRDRSHDAAYESTPLNCLIPIERIAALSDDSAALIRHLHDPYPG